MATPTLESFKTFLGLEDSDTQDDDALQGALSAALSAQEAVVAYPVDLFGEASYTSDLELAVHLRAQRYMARRNSPEGVVGLSGSDGSFVGARIPSNDTDVTYLEGPYRKVVVA